jgi:uncharacterized protein (TIGR02453 family)
MAAQRFDGFDDPKFFRALAKNQRRDWFLAHKDEYEAGFAQPMRLLLEEVAKKLDKSYPDLELAEPKVFRIHRDVRFSKDKSPYKTHVAGVLPVRLGDGKVTETAAALYLHIGASERVTGGGLYHFDARQLTKYRAAVVDEKKGKQLAKLTRDLEQKGATIRAAETLKSAPRGIDPDHPRAALLKQKGLVGMFENIPLASLGTRKLADWLVMRGKLLAPLVRWLAWETR